eukprot:TRINITY_DN6214_c0_g2_i1.p1 TRINITY_DN6214_c0_g2~~TRINITY_DN6214_c0_g2_i1.p1  ORF type:complete len:1284 (-),score=293.69 TRINITY_DN6214_c0_g2_i1:50-3901(-)
MPVRIKLLGDKDLSKEVMVRYQDLDGVQKVVEKKHYLRLEKGSLKFKLVLNERKSPRKQETDVCVIGFSIHSTDDVKKLSKFMGDFTRENPSTPVLVIGRSDLGNSDKPIDHAMGYTMASSIGAAAFYIIDNTSPESEMVIDEIYSTIKNLSTIPRDIKGKKKVDLSNRGLNVFPAYISSTRNLTSLVLNNNKISDFSCKQLAGGSSKFRHLTKLDLSFNKLDEMTPLISSMQKLRFLNLSHNNLGTIPDTLADCVDLKKLIISDNHLDNLPTSLHLLSKLELLDMDNNPMSMIPIDYITSSKSGCAKVNKLRRYLKSIHNVETVPQNRVKVMFVGDANVGKTTLLDNFRRKNFKDNDFNNIATDGIDIKEVSHEKAILDCWDFAGQELYYTTHQFFLSERAIYLVVINFAEPNFRTSEYWIKSIRLRNVFSPILIVGTHCDEISEDAIEDMEVKLRKRFAKYKVEAIITLDNHSISKKHITAVKEQIVGIATKRRLIGAPIPTSGQTLIRKVISMKEEDPWMLLEDFQEILEIIEIDVEKHTLLLNSLHDMGYILYMQDDQYLSDLVILDPQFLTSLMSAIVSLANNFHDGFISQLLVNNIFTEYEEEMHSKFIKILQNFEVLYPTTNNDGEDGYIVPCMLPNDPPQEFIDFDRNMAPDGERMVGRKYEFNFMPFGFFSRLATRISGVPTISCSGLWKYGLIVSAGSQTGILEYNPDKYDLSIYVRGLAICSLKLMSVIIESVDTLLEVFYANDKHKTDSRVLYFGENGYEGVNFYYFDLIQSIVDGHTDIEHEGEMISISEIAPDIGSILDLVLDNVEISDLLGEGAFGSVYKGTINGTTEIAVKSLKLQSEDIEQFREFIHEVNVMKNFDSKYLVQLYGTTITPFAMVMEYCPGKSLDYHLYDKELSNEDFPWSVKLKIALDMAKGLKVLHTQKPLIIHRDLRSPNVFIMSIEATPGEVNAKIGDFGLSQYSLPALNEMLACWQWLAPEVFDPSSKSYDETSDIYSFGMVLWELASREVPFSEYEEYITKRSEVLSDVQLSDPHFISSLESQGFYIEGDSAIQELYQEHEVKNAIINEDLRPTIPEDTPSAIASLIRDCWQKGSKLRPSLDEIILRIGNIMNDDFKDAGFTDDDLGIADDSIKHSTSSYVEENMKFKVNNVMGTLKINSISALDIYLKENSSLSLTATFKNKKQKYKPTSREGDTYHFTNMGFEVECYNTSTIRLELSAKTRKKMHKVKTILGTANLLPQCSTLGINNIILIAPNNQPSIGNITFDVEFE